MPYESLDSNNDIVYSGAYASAPDPTSILGRSVILTDVGRYGGSLFLATSGGYRPYSGTALNMLTSDPVGLIVCGTLGATYSQTGTTVTVTKASHIIPSWLNGEKIHLTQSTGALVTGVFTNFTYVDANTFTCTSSVSQSTSGNLGTNTSETYNTDTFVVPANLLKKNDIIALTFLDVAAASAGTKTRRCYYNSVASAASAATTTGGLITNPGGGSLTYVTDTTYESPSLDATPLSEGNRTFTYSQQLSVGSDWAYRRLITASWSAR